MTLRRVAWAVAARVRRDSELFLRVLAKLERMRLGSANVAAFRSELRAYLKAVSTLYPRERNVS